MVGSRRPPPDAGARHDPSAQTVPAGGRRPRPRRRRPLLAARPPARRPRPAARRRPGPRPRRPRRPAGVRPRPPAAAGRPDAPRGPARRTGPSTRPSTDPAAVDGLVAPDGRLALPFVGTDPVADAVWLDAIDDPTVPADERKALITDLAAAGLPDPGHVTDDDVPTILSRLALIEQIAPDALDPATAAALDQAHADLERLLPDPPPADRPAN